jgi:hypothetical protein
MKVGGAALERIQQTEMSKSERGGAYNQQHTAHGRAHRGGSGQSSKCSAVPSVGKFLLRPSTYLECKVVSARTSPCNPPAKKLLHCAYSFCSVSIACAALFSSSSP